VLASWAGVDLVVLRRSLNELIEAGFVELTDEGFRLSTAERQAVRDRRKGQEVLAAEP
jgi:DNA-binding transcriptional regulator YhcF (GntR family)